MRISTPRSRSGCCAAASSTTPRYAGARIFGSGLNLTRLFRGSLPFMFFVTRVLGYVNRIFRGLRREEDRIGQPEEAVEKLWIAVAETYAIGGACQLLQVADHVIAARGCLRYVAAASVRGAAARGDRDQDRRRGGGVGDGAP